MLVLFLSIATLACGRSIVPQDSPGNAGSPPATPIPTEKTLSSFNPILGTDYLMAGIVPVAVGRNASLNPFEWISNSGYSGYAPYVTYNYVFFNTHTEEYHRLLPTNAYVIMSTTGYPQKVFDPNNPDVPAPTVEFWVYIIVKADFNSDGSLDSQDKQTIGISEVGGGNYTELIENADAILSQYYKDQSNLFIIYNVNKKNFIARIDPITRAVVSTTEMDLGEDVK